MRKLFSVIKIANDGRNLLYNFVPRRGAKFQENLKWVKPEKRYLFDPVRSGDLEPFPEPNLNATYLPFKDSKELQTADENVKKVFSLGHQMPKNQLDTYIHELVERVKSNALDDSSIEVKIAISTAKIRYYQSILMKRPTRYSQLRRVAGLLIERRTKNLKQLRLEDYKKFEWLLEKLELEYRPPVPVLDQTVTRKKSLTRLAKLKVEQVKEARLAELKKSYDEQKIPFLEKKIEKLKEIREKEEKYNLPRTVTEEDIEECAARIEKVKVEIAERAKRGYLRKIHPYFIEPYEDELLWEREKGGEIIRQRQELEAEKESSAS